MRTIEEHGAQHVHELVMDDDAYNAVGEHLRNDEDQSSTTMAATVFVAMASVAIILAILL